MCAPVEPAVAVPCLEPPPPPPARPAPGLDDVTLGGLDDLRRAPKGGMDPNGLGASRLAADVLWSDPVGEPGFQPNVARGVGMVFGPDVTEVGGRLWAAGGCRGSRQVGEEAASSSSARRACEEGLG